MSFFSRLFESRVETKDQHSDSRLRTRYYKSTKSKIMETCRHWIEQESYLKLIDQSEERGEIAAQVNGKRKGLLVITVVSTGALRTAVDVSFSVDRGLNFGFGQSLCDKLYDQLGKNYTQVTVN